LAVVAIEVLKRLLGDERGTVALDREEARDLGPAHAEEVHVWYAGIEGDLEFIALELADDLSFLDRPELLSASLSGLYEQVERIADGIRLIDYFLAVRAHEPLPSAHDLLNYPDYLAGWACKS
jgi:hypothetical protein